MKLARVRLENVRTVRDGTYAFAHGDGRPLDSAVISGPVASGKTTMLTAIAMALQRVAPLGRAVTPRAFLRPQTSHGSVEVTLVLNDEERDRVALRDPVASFTVKLSGARSENDERLLRLLSRLAPVDLVVADRVLEEPLGMQPAPNAATERRLQLADDHDKYRGVIPWIREGLRQHATAARRKISDAGLVMPGDIPDPLSGLRATFAAVCPWLRLADLGPDGATPMCVREDGTEQPWTDLSRAERDGLLLSAVFERHARPGRIVLIDRIDAHLHPDDQRRTLDVLQSRYACQLLVTAVSDRLLAETPEAQRIVLQR